MNYKRKAILPTNMSRDGRTDKMSYGKYLPSKHHLRKAKPNRKSERRFASGTSRVEMKTGKAFFYFSKSFFFVHKVTIFSVISPLKHIKCLVAYGITMQLTLFSINPHGLSNASLSFSIVSLWSKTAKNTD